MPPSHSATARRWRVPRTERGPRGLGVRQSSAAFSLRTGLPQRGASGAEPTDFNLSLAPRASLGCRSESGRGLPHSKTLARLRRILCPRSGGRLMRELVFPGRHAIEGVGILGHRPPTASSARSPPCRCLHGRFGGSRRRRCSWSAPSRRRRRRCAPISRSASAAPASRRTGSCRAPPH